MWEGNEYDIGSRHQVLRVQALTYQRADPAKGGKHLRDGLTYVRLGGQHPKFHLGMVAKKRDEFEAGVARAADDRRAYSHLSTSCSHGAVPGKKKGGGFHPPP
jgi:hypothetical protein